LASLFPGSAHVRELGLQGADDSAIWERAAAEGFTIVTRDDDFRQRSFLLGQPPKIIWLRLGNCPTEQVAAELRARHPEIRAFSSDPQTALLVLGRRS
jgi:predicted nuclease of predicted toxin-antitoxin system